MNYKRILASAMALCLAVPMTAVIPEISTSSADVVVSNVGFSDIYQYKNCGDHIEIMSTSTTAEGTVEVPAEIDGLPVTAIGEHGLAGLSNVTEIVLPDTVTTIGKQAFSYNTKLEAVNIPYGVEIIPDEAFMNCMSLKSIDIPSSVTSIGVRAFYSCRNLTEIILPESVETISEMAFADCQGLTKINIPSGVTRLESAVFGNCSSLESLVVENVKFIAKDALPTRIKNLTIHNYSCELEDGLYMFITKDCVIKAYPGSPAQEFAETYGLQFESLFVLGVPTPGDVNNDGLFSIADVVMMQNYLLGNGTLTERRTADMDFDGEIDVFDYIIMRQELPNSPELNPPYDVDPVLDYAKNLTVDIKSNEITGAELDSDFTLSQTEFALDLFKKELSDENTLVSPYSVMQALSMTANGAGGNTKSEMEDVLGMPMDSLNKYLYTFRTSQHNDENSKLSTANSIWAINGLDVNRNFLQTDVDYYNADFFTAPFDNTTVTDINNWVNEKTDEMIPEIIDEIGNNAIMYLINAVAFDAKWETEFDKYMTVEADFTAIDGSAQTAEMMTAYGGVWYMKDDNAEGIYKYYKDRKYAFVAMLPDENISVNDYISVLTAEKLSRLLANPVKEYTGVEIPKFSYDFKTNLNNTLIEMGMPSAFERIADFSNMVSNVDGPVYISDVIHKTHIEVDEGGTKAAAATSVEISNDSVPMLPEKNVVFDRPFVYFIIDTEANIPVFMGTLTDVSE
ncbi:MAG: leucine-rich repeat protein [Ruminococcus flavefaciens]|nr:leucine-rich repeat protein [Ruminococcus flavefaciens]MCM1229568.1 leucine-rich repeat protein [Ruminococcus flavefaciens]